MALSTDLKFILLVSPRFERFQRKSDYLFNCRCPLCGDSQTNKSKMRGYIYRKQDALFYKCHNCGSGLSAGNLLKELDPNLHKEYIMEKYRTGEIKSSNTRTKTVYIPSPRFGKVDKVNYHNAERCDRLSSNHFCITYLNKRKIPKEYFSKLHYTDNFKLFCDEVNPNHGKELIEDKRLIIPFFDQYDALFGVSGRSLETAGEKLRYIKIRTDNSERKLIYGLDRVDLTKRVFIVEGEIDSLFLDNCIASGDSSLAITADSISCPDKVLVFDNEPRNKEITTLLKKAIESNHKVVIWPDNIRSKDINDMVVSGMKVSQIQSIISSNTFQGLEALTKFTFWKKV